MVVRNISLILNSYVGIFRYFDVQWRIQVIFRKYFLCNTNAKMVDTRSLFIKIEGKKLCPLFFIVGFILCLDNADNLLCHRTSKII